MCSYLSDPALRVKPHCFLICIKCIGFPSCIINTVMLFQIKVSQKMTLLEAGPTSHVRVSVTWLASLSVIIRPGLGSRTHRCQLVWDDKNDWENYNHNRRQSSEELQIKQNVCGCVSNHFKDGDVGWADIILEHLHCNVLLYKSMWC